MGITIDGMDELMEELRETAKKYPDVAEKALTASGKKFKSAVIKETHAAVGTITGNLAKGYRLDPVEGYGKYMYVNFRATAKHFHLIENGHNQVTQNTKKGKKVANGGRVIGFVPGRLIVAAVRADYQTKFPLQMEDELTRLLKENNLI